MKQLCLLLRFPSDIYHRPFYTSAICTLCMSTDAVQTVRTANAIIVHVLEKQTGCLFSVLYLFSQFSFFLPPCFLGCMFEMCLHMQSPIVVCREAVHNRMSAAVCVCGNYELTFGPGMTQQSGPI